MGVADLAGVRVRVRVRVRARLRLRLRVRVRVRVLVRVADDEVATPNPYWPPLTLT